MVPAGRCPVVSNGHARLPGVWSVDLTRGRRSSCPQSGTPSGERPLKATGIL